MTDPTRSASLRDTIGSPSLSDKIEPQGLAFSRSALLCGLLVIVFVLACRPAVEVGYVDDWSMARTARIFAESGHFVYNGWAAMPEGWQIVWAALFIKLFGFSYAVVRFSLLPVVFTTIYLFQQCLRGFGLTEKNASFGAVTLGLSPVFVPIASTFMTDVSGLMVIILCLFLCQKAMAETSSRGPIFWLAVAALTNLVGGTVRQTAWLGVLVMVPSTGWALRRRRGVAAVAFSLTALSCVGIFAFLNWYRNQPYSVPEKIFSAPIGVATLAHLADQLFDAFVFVLLCVTPILAAFLPAMFRLRARIFWSIYIFLAAVVLFAIATSERSSFGVVLSKFNIHATLPATATVLAAIALLFELLRRLVFGKEIFGEQKRVATFPWRDILWLLGPYSLVYFLLLIPRGATSWIWDRYVLGLAPLAIVCLLKTYQDRIGAGISKFAIILLVILGIFGVAKADKRYSENRARLEAADILLAQNIPRTAISNGFEYDCETQLDATGYVNEPKIEVPAGAYHPIVAVAGVPAAAGGLSVNYTPSVLPRYFLVPMLQPFLVPTKYPPINYRTLLPPFHRHIYIEQLPGTDHPD
jgi:hypothetical protein